MPEPREPDQPYIDPDAIRAAVTGLSDMTTDDPPVLVFSDETLARFVARFETLAEQGITGKGVAFTPRTATETVKIGRSRRLLVDHSRATTILSITYDVGTAPDVGDVDIEDGCELVLAGCMLWPWGTWVTVTYLHGYPEPPAAIIDGCIEFVRAEAIQQEGSQPRNVTGERTELGWIPTPTADPGKGRPTRWQIVNEALAQVPDETIPGIG